MEVVHIVDFRQQFVENGSWLPAVHEPKRRHLAGLLHCRGVCEDYLGKDEIPHFLFRVNKRGRHVSDGFAQPLCLAVCLQRISSRPPVACLPVAFTAELTHQPWATFRKFNVN